MSVLLPRVFACLAAACLASAPLPSLAQSGSFGLELNSALDRDNACRATFVATNNTGFNLTAVSYEVVVWDSRQTIPDNGFLIFEFGQMPSGKTKVVQFDFPERLCNDISRVLINDQTECVTESGDADFCIKMLVANSRTTVLFGK